jgi:hypothetical protein
MERRKSLKIPYIEDKHTTQWPKKVQKDKQRSTKHTKHKAKDQATQTPLKNYLLSLLGHMHFWLPQDFEIFGFSIF